MTPDAPGAVMIRSLYFVQLTVADWPAAVAWYRDALGLEVLLSVAADQFALLRAGTAQLALKAGRPEPGTVQLTFEVDDLPGELDRLAALGIRAEEKVQTSPEGYRRALLRDPDGYRVCLFEWIKRS